MSDASNLPLSLYKANLDLWLRLGELLQENRDQWMELLSRELHDTLVETRAEAHQLQAAEDWPSLAMLPGSTLWRIAEQQIGDLQALAQTAAGNQVTFVNGFQQALSDWQEATAGAFGGAVGGAGAPTDLLETLRSLSEAVLPATISAAIPDAPARKPAKKAAAKKRAARKAAAKTNAEPVRKATKKATKKTAKKVTKKAAKKATRKTAKRAGKKAAR